MKKVLIVTYYWPPGSGAGVQRWLKFSKYLPSFNWQPVILTIDPEYAAYPATDSSLENEVSSEIEVVRTKATDWFRLYRRNKSGIPSAGFATGELIGFKEKLSRFIRGNFFIPDPRRGWNKYAFKEACRLIEKYGITHVITTSPPHSTQLTGLKLKKRYPDIKWIADLRDPWTDIYYYKQFYPTPISRAVDSYYERQVLISADRIITVGKTLKNLFASKGKGIEEKTEVIYNGYDEFDFKMISQAVPDEFTISYIGTLSDSYPISGFLEALRILDLSGHKIRLKFIGTVSSGQKTKILSARNHESVDFIPYVNHESAIRYMTGSSCLLMIIPDHVSNKAIITGKIFEYIASGKPVLCLGPEDGDAAEILESSEHGSCSGYSDPAKTANILTDFISKGNRSLLPPPEEYSRKSLTEKLILIF